MPDEFLLDEQACFALYAASRAVTDAYRPLLGELDLTYPQYLVLLVLWENGDSPVKDLGAALQLDYGTLSPLLKRLEANGLVRRARRADDERSVSVALTEEGLALRDRALSVPPVIGTAMGLEDAEFEELRGLLSKLTTSVQAYTA